MSVDIDTQALKRKNIIEATRKKFGEDRVLNICTFKKEKSKDSIKTIARALGIDPDTSNYLASMIPVVRGATTSLDVMVNGDEENNIAPNKVFIEECNKAHKDLLKIAQGIEGIVSGRSIHASGVIIFDNPCVENNAIMRAPNGQLITQFNMDDSTYMGGLKYDYLTVEALDVMRICMDFLVKYGKIEWQGSLRSTYEKYFHPDVIDYATNRMWEMAINLEIINLFQFSTQVGIQCIQKVKPHSLTEMGVANAIMRLMAQDGKEQPIDIYVKYKNDISLWYKCMREQYHLTEDEIKIVEKYLKNVSGMATMQEEVMQLVMEQDISNFTMQEANKLRKSIAKKKKKLQESAKELFYSKGREFGASDNLLNYVWNECISLQLGYSFSLPHILAYSTIAIQEMNMAYKFPIIYWNTANLIVNSGSAEEDNDKKNKTTNYGKIASAIGEIQNKTTTKIAYPLINSAEFGFIPDEENDRIIFSLKALVGVGDKEAKAIIENRPYTSLDDFIDRMILTKYKEVNSEGKEKSKSLVSPSAMINLIKAGAFTELDGENRVQTMRKFMFKCKVKKSDKITFASWNNILYFDKKYNFIPEEMKELSKHKFFKDYVLDTDYAEYENYIDPNKKTIPKVGYHDRYFVLDDEGMRFFKEGGYNQSKDESCIVGFKGEYYIISEKKFLKENKKILEPFKEWLNSSETLKQFNEFKLQEEWEKYCKGNISKWEMDSMSCYIKPHELHNLQTELYGICKFSDLPETPQVYSTYKRNIKEIDEFGFVKWKTKYFPKYSINRIAGTVLDVNKDKHLITLLTNDNEVVSCKFNKGQFLHYYRSLTAILNEEDEKATTIEKAWLSRGNIIILTGYRQEQQFRVYNYNDTIYKHTCNLVTGIHEDGTLDIKIEREREEDYDYRNKGKTVSI